MAITRVSQLEEIDGSHDADGRHYVHQWQVLSDNYLTDTEGVVLSAAGLPARLSINPKDETTACSHKTIISRERTGNGGAKWIIGIHYEPRELVLAGHNGQAVTILDHKEYWYEWVPKWVAVEQAYRVNTDGSVSTSLTPVTNSAGQKLDPPPEQEEYNLMLVYERNQLHYNVGLAIDYANAISSDFFWNSAPGQAKCWPILASPRKFDNDLGIYFYTVTYRIEFADTWVGSFLNQGTKHKDALTTNIVPTENNRMVNLAVVDSRILADTEPAEYIQWVTYKKRRALSLLGLTPHS